MPKTPLLVQPGQLIASKYRVERLLGEGGMGQVVAARHLDLGRLFAIKLLTSDDTDPQAVERFLREARAASQLASQHVVRVSDVGRLDSGAPYMVLEYLEGEDLSDRLREQGPRPVGEVIDHVMQACEALAEAHAAGIVHRDIKPSNLFLAKQPDGSSMVKVLDFGISKLLSNELQDGALTTTATILGSPRYMSPEQLRNPREVDTRTDIWALGIVLHELLSGRVPFHGETLAGISLAIMTEPPAPLRKLRPEVPAGVEQAVLRCLEKDKEARWATVGELAEALEPYGSSGHETRAQRISRIQKADPRAPPEPPPEPPPANIELTATSAATSPRTTGPDSLPASVPLASTASLVQASTGASTETSAPGGKPPASPLPTIMAAVAGLGVVAIVAGFVLREPPPSPPVAIAPASSPPASSPPTAPTAIPVPPPATAEPAPSATASARPAPTSTATAAAATAAPTTTTKATSAPIKANPKPPKGGDGDGMDARK